MNTDDGRIYTLEELAGMSKAKHQSMNLVPIVPTATQMARLPRRVGRNELCPCGSGKKFKRCCLKKAH